MDFPRGGRKGLAQQRRRRADSPWGRGRANRAPARMIVGHPKPVDPLDLCGAAVTPLHPVTRAELVWAPRWTCGLRSRWPDLREKRRGNVLVHGGAKALHREEVRVTVATWSKAARFPPNFLFQINVRERCVLIYAAAGAQTQPIFPILRAASFVHGTPRTRQERSPRASTDCQCARPPCAGRAARR